MYKVLGSVKKDSSERDLSESPVAETECVCQCKKAVEKNQEKTPAGDDAAIFLGVDLDING